MPEATIRCAAPLAVLAAAQARGLSRARVFEAAGIDALPDDARATIPLASHFAIFAACMRILQDPGFPIDVAQAVLVDAYDVMGFAMRSAPTLLAAMEVSRRFQALYSSGGSYETEVGAEWVVLRYRPSGPLPLAARCATESAIAQAVHVGGALVGSALQVDAVSFRHPRPASTARHEAFFGVAPAWDAPFASLRLSRSELARPVVHADPSLHAFLSRTAEDALAAIAVDPSFTDDVRRAILEGLPAGQADAPRVARRLGLSERTLRRRLDDEAATFSGIRDEVRRGLAERYLTERDLPIPEIAFLLDFADERAFRRSFQRWTGRSPAAHRRDAITGKPRPRR